MQMAQKITDGLKILYIFHVDLGSSEETEPIYFHDLITSTKYLLYMCTIECDIYSVLRKSSCCHQVSDEHDDGNHTYAYLSVKCNSKQGECTDCLFNHFLSYSSWLPLVCFFEHFEIFYNFYITHS